MYTKFTFLLFVLFLFSTTAVSAQGPIGGFFSAKGDGSVTVSYTYVKYDAFYVADQKSPDNGVPAHGSIDQNIYSIYAKYGVTDDLTLVAIAPYISASSGNDAADPVNGESSVSGFQDFSLWAKYRPFTAGFTGGRVDGLLAAGYSVAGGYEANGILSIGSGASAAELKAGAQVNLDNGLFATAIVGYSFRGTAESDVTAFSGLEFDVPNAVNLMAKVGYAGSKFYLEAWVANQNSTDGIDIGSDDFTGNFPETEVDFTTIGASAYVPLNQVIGLSVGYGTTVSGRNVGDSNYVNGGVTLSF